MDAIWVLMLISLAAVPLALALRKVKLGEFATWRIEAVTAPGMGRGRAAAGAITRPSAS